MFLLRVVQAGLSIADLDDLEYGEVTDIIIEAGNDHAKYATVATQSDFDKF